VLSRNLILERGHFPLALFAERQAQGFSYPRFKRHDSRIFASGSTLQKRLAIAEVVQGAEAGSSRRLLAAVRTLPCFPPLALRMLSE